MRLSQDECGKSQKVLSKIAFSKWRRFSFATTTPMNFYEVTVGSFVAINEGFVNVYKLWFSCNPYDFLTRTNWRVITPDGYRRYRSTKKGSPPSKV